VVIASFARRWLVIGSNEITGLMGKIKEIHSVKFGMVRDFRAGVVLGLKNIGCYL